MIIKKYNIGNIGKRSAIIAISFFVYVIISTIIISSIDEGRFASHPVASDLFGSYFVMGHMGIVSGLIFLFTAVFILNKTDYLKSPAILFMEQEKKEFYDKYGLKFNAEIPKVKKYMALTTAITSTFIPAVLPLIAINFFGVEDHTFAVIIGIILMFIGFYGSIGYLIKLSHVKIGEILEAVNNLHEGTKLTSPQYNVGHNFLSACFKMLVEGNYKFREVKAEYSASGTSYNKGFSRGIESDVSVKISIDEQIEFTLKETDYKWKSYEGISIESCFSKRFKISARNPAYLPESFKENAVKYNRQLSLKAGECKLIYHIKNMELLPFYTIEGIALFLDFLISLAEEVERH